MQQAMFCLQNKICRLSLDQQKYVDFYSLTFEVF